MQITAGKGVGAKPGPVAQERLPGAGLGQYLAGDVVQIGQARADGRMRSHGGQGALLRQARGQRSMVEVAAASGVPVETLRKIEAGRIPTPAFLTVAAVAAAVGTPLDQLVEACAAGEPAAPGRAVTA